METEAKTWTREELVREGISDENIVDRSTHPSVRMISWDTPPGIRQHMGSRWDYAHYHIKPQAVLVATIGNLWGENCWWRLQDMLLQTAMAGYSVSVHEITDTNMLSIEAIALMRWQASMLARDGGIEWLFMVDNDVLLEKDTLLRLLAHDRPVIFPLIEDREGRFPKQIAPISDPSLEAGHGLQPVRWAVMSAMLFNPRIFSVLEPTAWRGSDFLFSQALHAIGHRIYVDTDAVVQVVKGPARHASKKYDEFWADRQRMWNRLRHEDRDRRPPPGFDPRRDNGWVDKHGTYFGVLNGNGAKK